MTLLFLGLVLFLAPHAIRIVADGLRASLIARFSPNGYKLVYSVVSLLGLVLIVYGYAEARGAPVAIFAPPTWTRHLAALLTIPAFVLLAAVYVPGTRIKARLGHPMVLGVKVWAFAHLLSNGTLHDMLLFGTFLAWSVALFAVSRGRDRREGVVRAPGSTRGDAIAVAAGLAAWAVFAFWLHGLLIGVRPFG
jgi:uncharacterized membrane protein